MAARTVLHRVAAGLVATLALAGLGTAQNVATAHPAANTSSAVDSVAALAAGAFVSLPPSRILDTRARVGATGPLAARGTVHLQVAGRGGVPASGASAVALSVTVTQPQRGGHVTAYPDGSALPTVSNLNFRAGQTVANLVVVKLGVGGKVALTNTSSGTSQLVADVAGFWTGGSGSSPGAFTALGPARLLDSRSGTGIPGAIPARGTVDLQVTGRGGVPASGVAAVVMNVTVTRPTAGGHLTTHPAGSTVPATSNLNFRAGQTVPNLVVVKLGVGGKVALTNGSAVSLDLVADIAGYFAAGSGTTAGAFTAVGPSRILDSRSGVGTKGLVAGRGTVHLQVMGRGGVPASGVSAVVMNVTVTQPSRAGHITAYPSGASRPTASNLNFGPSETVANLVVVQVGSNGKVALTNDSGGGIHLVADVAGYFAAGACTPSTVWNNLEGCGWPGPTNTGHPDGQVFSRTVTGGLVVTADNTVIDGWRITGGVHVRARNVVIRNSHVTMSARGMSGSGVVNLNPGSSARIERTTLDGQNATHACVWDEASSMTVTAVDCSRVNDGIFMWATQVGKDGPGDHFVIQDSWLHGFTTDAANGHVDGIQTEGAKHGVIHHNTIDVTQSQTAAVALWNGRKSLDDVRVERNLIAGGGFSVYAQDYSPSQASPAGGYTVTNVVFADNVFSTVHFGCVGSYGVWFPRGAPTDGWNRSGNVVLETGQNLDSGNPTHQGRACT